MKTAARTVRILFANGPVAKDWLLSEIRIVVAKREPCGRSTIQIYQINMSDMEAFQNRVRLSDIAQYTLSLCLCLSPNGTEREWVREPVCVCVCVLSSLLQHTDGEEEGGGRKRGEEWLCAHSLLILLCVSPQLLSSGFVNKANTWRYVYLRTHTHTHTYHHRNVLRQMSENLSCSWRKKAIMYDKFAFYTSSLSSLSRANWRI